MNIYKRMIPILLFGAVASSTSFAQVNNTGQIVLQGAVPGCWELTVFDINSGFDFDLSDSATSDLTARVGTIHIFTNDSSDFLIDGIRVTFQSDAIGNDVLRGGNDDEHPLYTYARCNVWNIKK